MYYQQYLNEPAIQRANETAKRMHTPMTQSRQAMQREVLC